MPTFKISDLPDKTKTMHSTQNRWRKRNWEDTLKNEANDLEDLLSLIEVFDIWKNRLPKDDATKSLSREIFADAYMSIHLAGFGLYKNAYMSLRSQLETAMRLIYFSNHLLEYKLWQDGDEKWIGDLLKGSDVWGQNFKYFLYIPEVNQLEDKLQQGLKLINGSAKLKEIYSKLSKHVHSGGPFLQTRKGHLSSKYSQAEFDSWIEIYKDVQKYINILFALCFSDYFKKMPADERDSILNLAIGVDYKDFVKQICEIP
jgi:hypothetical protein